MMRSRATSLGAAAFALGLSLAGPQALGVASADTDTGDGDTAAVSPRAGAARPAARDGRQVEHASVAQRVARPAAAVSTSASESGRTKSEAPRAAAAIDIEPTDVADSDPVQVAVVDDPVEITIPARSTDTPQPYWRGTGGESVDAPTVVAYDVPVATPLAVSGHPTIISTPDLQQSISGLNTAVAGLFDAVTHLLSSLPANPVSELLSGALLLVRRSLFNQAPTVDPAQLVTTVDGQILGTLGAVDPEADALTYTVTAAPQYGSVAVDAEGNFTYTPGDEYALGDTFRVTVADNGFNLLDPSRGPTEVDVNVGAPLGRSTKGFDVYNWTSQTIKYVGDHGTYLINPWVYQAPDSGPTMGWELKPGESAHFEVVFNAFQDTYAAPEFQATDGSYGRWSAALELDAFYTRDATCSNYKNSCSVSDDGTKVYFLDAPGTVIDVPAGQGQRQADVLRLLCNDKNAGMTCQFTPAKDGFKQTLTDAKFAAPPLRNNSSSDATLTLSRNETVETTSSVSLTGSAKVTILKIFEAGVERNSTQSLTTSTQWSYSIGVLAKPGEWAVLTVKDPIKRVTGDFTGTIGNTTWILRDVSFDTPDPDPARPPLPESGLPPGVSDQGKPVYTAYSSPLNPAQPIPSV